MSARPFYANNRKVGRIDGDTLKKTVDADKHFLRCPPAIAFELDSLRQVRAEGVQWAEVTDKKNRRIYRASVDAILKVGREMERGGFERQIYLTLDRWQVRAVGQPVPDPKPDTPNDDARPHTLPLFGELDL